LSNPTPEQLLLRRVAKIYIAGSSYETDRAERMTAALLERGIHVTSTWPRIVRTVEQRVGVAHLREIVDGPAEAIADRRAARVRCAFLVPPIAPAEAHTRGGWIEAGYAMGLGKIVIFAGDTKQSIFCALGYEVIDDTDALRVITEIANHSEVEMANARTEATRWKTVAQELARRLRSLKGIADSDVEAVIRGELAEAARG
jgi:nucleoside 2-deoxyribosyltransferase